MKSCFAGLYIDGFDFIQGLDLGFHLSGAKISPWLATISLNRQKKRDNISAICYLFLLVYGNPVSVKFVLRTSEVKFAYFYPQDNFTYAVNFTCP